MLRPFDHIHQRARHQHDHQHHRQEHQDLAAAGRDGPAQRLVFLHVGRELEDAEHPQQAQHPHVDEGVQLGEEQRQVGGGQGQQVHDAEEAAGIAPGPLHTQQPGRIFQCEGHGEQPLGSSEPAVGHRALAGHAVEHHHHDAEQDDADQHLVEQAPQGRVRLEDDGVQPQAPAPVGAPQPGGVGALGTRWRQGGGRGRRRRWGHKHESPSDRDCCKPRQCSEQRRCPSTPPSHQGAGLASFSCSVRHITLPLPLLGKTSTNCTERGAL